MGEILRFTDSYVANRSFYEDHRNWLDSTRESLSQYLIITELENINEIGKGFYRERLAYLDTDNDIFNLVFIHSASLTRKKPVWGGLESQRAQILLKNLDGKRNSAWKVAKETIWELFAVGAAVLETFAPEKISPNAAQAKANGERSYTRLRPIEHLVRWEFFDDDGPYMGELKEVVLTHRVTLGEDGEKHQTYKRLWIDEGAGFYNQQILRSVKAIKDFGANVEQVEVEPDPKQGAPTTGELPYLPVTIVGDPDDGVRHTTIFRPINDARVVLNQQSFYDRAGRYAGFERNIIATDKKKELDRIPVSEIVTTIIDDPDAKVFTLQPSDPVAIWRNIQVKRRSIKYKVLLQFNQGLNPESKESPSVEAKEADQEARKEFYDDITDEIEDAFNHVFRIHADIEGESAIRRDDVAILFNRDFSMFNFTAEQNEKAARWIRASSMGEGGFEIRRRETINDALTMPILTQQNENESEVRKDIVEKLMNESAQSQTSPLGAALLQRRAGNLGLQQAVIASSRDGDGDGRAGE